MAKFGGEAWKKLAEAMNTPEYAAGDTSGARKVIKEYPEILAASDELIDEFLDAGDGHHWKNYGSTPETGGGEGEGGEGEGEGETSKLFAPMAGGEYNWGKQSRGLFTESAGMSRQMWDDWETHGRPTLEAMASNLANRNTEAHAERMAGLAAADTNQAFDTEEGNFRRNLQRYGVSPTSGRAMSGLRDLSLGRAGAVAGAKTKSRISTEDRLFRDQGMFIDATGRLGSAGMTGTAQAAQGLAGIDASERAAALADLNARRSARVSLEAIAAGERNQVRAGEAARYAADREYKTNAKDRRDANLWTAAGALGRWIFD